MKCLLCLSVTAESVKPVVAMPTTTSDEHLTSPSTKSRTAHHANDDVFSRLDNRRDGVFSRLDNRNSFAKSDYSHSNDSNEVTSSLDTTQPPQQPITTIISKRRIKLTDIKDNAISSSPPSTGYVTSVHQPPTNKVVCHNIQLLYLLIVRKSCSGQCCICLWFFRKTVLLD